MTQRCQIYSNNQICAIIWVQSVENWTVQVQLPSSLPGFLPRCPWARHRNPTPCSECVCVCMRILVSVTHTTEVTASNFRSEHRSICVKWPSPVKTYIIHMALVTSLPRYLVTSVRASLNSPWITRHTHTEASTRNDTSLLLFWSRLMYDHFSHFKSVTVTWLVARILDQTRTSTEKAELRLLQLHK